MEDLRPEVAEETRENTKVNFRDRIPTMTDEGKRRWIYPKRPRGKFTTWRWIVAIVLLAFFFAAPWIKYRGEPFMLFDVIHRKFILFGVIFWPQDFHLIVIGLITLIVFIILFTVIYGRLFCGWTCPQTIFMEFVFRQIEYLIEGDYHKQKKLARQPLNPLKILKKTSKHLLFIVTAFLIVLTLSVYLLGPDELTAILSRGPAAHPTAFVLLGIFTGVIYFIYGFFREQVCIIVCPYGRLQGALLDSRSMVVAYDYRRGEPRGKYNPLENRATSGKGDCIDCSSCVVVCPTGIDIRNGTQLECINCTACIDACNAIMDKVRLPRGLIKHASEKAIEEGKHIFFNPRAIAYSVVLVALLVLLASMFVRREAAETTIIRMPGTLYQEYGPDHYSNIYKIQVVNKTRKKLPIEVKLLSPETGEIKFITGELLLLPESVSEGNFLVILPKKQLHSSNIPLEFGIFSESKLISHYRLNFVGPNTLDTSAGNP